MNPAPMNPFANAIWTRPLAPATSISKTDYDRVMSLFNEGIGRGAAYAEMFRLTQNGAFLTSGQVATGSGAIVGGPAWTFNEVLKWAMETYPQDKNAIRQFSIEVAAGELASIKPDPVNPDRYIVPSELSVLDAAIQVWAAKGLLTVSPPALVKAIRQVVNRSDTSAVRADLTAGTTLPSPIQMDQLEDITSMQAESQRYAAESIAYVMKGLGGHELFTDAHVDTAARGLRVLAEIDVNGDKLITLADPALRSDCVRTVRRERQRSCRADRLGRRRVGVPVLDRNGNDNIEQRVHSSITSKYAYVGFGTQSKS